MHKAWEQGLRESATFLCLITRNYLRTPECWEQVALARRLHKPCIALIEKGTHLPQGFLDGFLSLEIHYFTGTKDLEDLAKVLGHKLGTVNLIDGGVC